MSQSVCHCPRNLSGVRKNLICEWIAQSQKSWCITMLANRCTVFIPCGAICNGCSCGWSSVSCEGPFDRFFASRPAAGVLYRTGKARCAHSQTVAAKTWWPRLHTESCGGAHGLVKREGVKNHLIIATVTGVAPFISMAKRYAAEKAPHKTHRYGALC